MEIDWTSIISNGSSVIQAFAVVVGVVVGIKSLGAWRSELVGRRRSELAEETLAAFYQAKEQLAWVRSPGSFSGEAVDRPQTEGEDETAGVKQQRDAYYVPLARLNKQSEFWAKFDASAYRFKAVFGHAATEPFYAVRKARNAVAISAHMLIECATDRDFRNRDNSDRKEWEAEIGWVRQKDDKILLEIDQALTAIEQTCRPAIEANARKSTKV